MAKQESGGGGLSKKYGGVPLYVYLGVGAIGVAGLWYERRKSAAAAAAAAAASANGSTTGTQAASASAPVAAGTYGTGYSDGGIGADTLAAILASQAGTGSSTSSTTTATGQTTSNIPGSAPVSTIGTAATPTTLVQAQGNGDAGNQLLDILGSITGANTFTGYNVSGGAPVYADVNGTWRIGLPASQIPVGSQLATPAAAASSINVSGGQVTEPL